MTRILLRQLYAPLLLALVVGLGVSHYWIYQKGQESVRAALLQERDAALSKQAEVADELERLKIQREAERRRQVEQRHRAPDPSGCDVVAAPGSVLDSFGYRGPRPTPDGTGGDPGAAGANQP